LPDLGTRLVDRKRKALLLKLLREVENDPSIMG
jgi:hypothetical protein